jgi:hypothetical protein
MPLYFVFISVGTAIGKHEISGIKSIFYQKSKKLIDLFPTFQTTFSLQTTTSGRSASTRAGSASASTLEATTTLASQRTRDLAPTRPSTPVASTACRPAARGMKSEPWKFIKRLVDMKECKLSWVCKGLI